MRRILPVAMAALLLASLCGSAAAKSFQIERFHSEVELLEDGSIRVTESLTYRFDGRFKFAWRMIPLRDGVSIGNLAVAENGRPYESSSTERPGTFYTAPTAEGVRVRWFYRARNEARTFTVSYILRGAVLRHPDVTEYYHKIIGDEESPRMGHVSARVTLPNRDWYASDLRAWAHGPLHGGITIESGRVVTAQVSPLYAGQFFEVRIVMPAGVFDNLPLQTNEPQLDRILSQEKGWADEANRRRERNAAATERYQEKRRVQREQARRWMPVAWVLAIVSVLGWVVLYRRHGTPYPVTPRSAPGAIPSEHPPAVVAQLVVSGVGGASLVATLLDLAQRGYLTVEEKTTVARGWFGRESTKKDFVFRSTGDNPGELQPFEAELLEFLFNELGDGTEFTMKGIRKAARKKRTKFRRWFMRWTKSVKKVADAEGFFEPYAVRAMVINGASGVVVGGIGVAMCVLSRSPAGAPALVAGFLQLLLTGALHRRTIEGRRLELEWKAFRKHLKSVSRGMGQPRLSSGDWSRYVAIAIVFGLHKKLIPQLSVDEADTGAYIPLWYLHTSGDGVGIAGLTDGFSAMIDSVSTTMSSASGAGGGASAGGGGGAGGGGAGAG